MPKFLMKGAEEGTKRLEGDSNRGVGCARMIEEQGSLEGGWKSHGH